MYIRTSVKFELVGYKISRHQTKFLTFPLLSTDYLIPLTFPGFPETDNPVLVLYELVLVKYIKFSEDGTVSEL